MGTGRVSPDYTQALMLGETEPEVFMRKIFMFLLAGMILISVFPNSSFALD
jgi:hypothetical protein